MLGLHFLVFFIAACSLRADKTLVDTEDDVLYAAALDGLGVADAFEDESEEEEDEEEEQEESSVSLLREERVGVSGSRTARAEHRAYLLLPRVTPTQCAMLPKRKKTLEEDDDTRIFAPLTWSNSQEFTSLEWSRFVFVRYALEFGLIGIFASGAASRDLTHLGYLLLSLTFLRVRDVVMVKGDSIWRYMRWYNLFAMASACCWTLVFGGVETFGGGLSGYQYDAHTDDASSTCSTAHVLGIAPQSGTLLPDVVNFGITYLLTLVLKSKTHASIVLMEREARIDAKKQSEDGRKKWLADALARRVRLAKEREERRRRAEDVRAHVEKLSREVLELEHRDRGHVEEGQGDKDKDSESSFVSVDEDESETENFDSPAPVQNEVKEVPSTPISPVERALHRIQHWVADRSSMLGLLIGGITNLVPWLAAPNFSGCYFLFFAAFAFDFSVLTLLYPTVLVCYGLLTHRKPSVTFWSSMLMYSELCLLLGFVWSIPCANGCLDWSSCVAEEATGKYQGRWVNVPVFLVYLAVLFHREFLLRNGEGKERGDHGMEGTMGVQNDSDSTSVDTFIAWCQSSAATTEAFFQRVLSPSAERDPSFIAIAITNVTKGQAFSSDDDSSSDGVNWHEVAAALNVTIREYYRVLGASNDAAQTDIAFSKNPPKITPVESDAASKKDFAQSFLADTSEHLDSEKDQSDTRKSAVFAVHCTSHLLTPAADVARVLQAAQLRNAAGDAIDDGQISRKKIYSYAFPALVAAVPFHRGGRDFYAATCVADFASFLFVLVFYQATVHADTSSEALTETYHQGLFPVDYVLAVTFCVFLIICDRVLYLFRWHTGKAVYHFLTYTFFCTITFRLYHHHGNLKSTEAGKAGLLRLFFLLKSASFALNARQLRSGYRGASGVSSGSSAVSGTKSNSRITLGPVSLIDDDGGGGGGGAPTSRTDWITYVGYNLYLAVPFLYELRVLLDYTCLDSSLDLHDWLKLENITRDLFKTNVRNQNYRKTHPFGVPQPRSKKLFQQGGGVFFLLLLIIVGPFFIFSTSNPQVGVNPVYGVNLNVSISSGQSVVSISSTAQIAASVSHTVSEFPLFQGGYRVSIGTPDSWRSLKTPRNAEKPPTTTLKQIQQVCVAPESDSVWNLPPPVLSSFNQSVLKVGALISVHWTFTRHLPLDNKVVFAESKNIKLDEQQVAQFRNALDYSFIDRAEGTTYDKETPPGITLNSLYPRVWRLYGNGDPVGNYTTDQQLECEMFLNDDGEKSRASVTRWWSLRCGAKEDDGTGDGTSTDTGNRSKKSSNNVFSPCASFGSGPEVVLVSSLVATGALASFSKLVGGVTGMYVVYVLAVGSFARSLTTNLVGKIPFHDLPNTHRLTRLTEDIYAMRRSREFVLEEKLFWLLIRIYRSPNVLFEFTRLADGGAEPLRPRIGTGTVMSGNRGVNNSKKSKTSLTRRTGWTSGEFF